MRCLNIVTNPSQSTFIYRVALNRALNWTRNRGRYRRRHVELAEIPVPNAPNESSGEQEQHVEQFYAALGTLSEVAGSGSNLRVWHAGAQSGAKGLLLLFPSQQAGIALLTNLEYAELRPTARALLSHFGTAWHDI